MINDTQSSTVSLNTDTVIHLKQVPVRLRSGVVSQLNYRLDPPFSENLQVAFVKEHLNFFLLFSRMA